MPLKVQNGIRIWPPPSAPSHSPGPSDDTLQPEFAPTTLNFAPAPHSLPVPFFRQELGNWCWAACVQMVMHYFEATTVEQCQVASLFFDDDSCADPDSFDFGCDAEDVRPIFGLQSPRVLCSHHDGTILFETLRREIDEEERPVVVAVLWFAPDGEVQGGHILLVKGWRMFDNRVFVKLNDPWYGRGDVSFKRLKRYYGPLDDGLDGVWVHTWTEIRR